MSSKSKGKTKAKGANNTKPDTSQKPAKDASVTVSDATASQKVEKVAAKTTKTVSSGTNQKLRKLTREGFSHTFVEKVDDFECSICTLVVRDPKLVVTCGHSFCCTCLDDWIESRDGPLLCPSDNVEFSVADVVPDRRLVRLVRGLKVHCDNRGGGCTKTPELRDVEVHLEKCEYRTVKCEKCGESVLCLQLVAHTAKLCSCRVVICGLCSVTMEAKYLQCHDAECPMKLVECEFCTDGGTVIPRKDLKEHQTTSCIKLPTFCSFALIGCKQQVAREQLSSHHIAHTQEHLRLLNSAVYHLYDDVGTPWLRQPSVDGDAAHELPLALWGDVTEGDWSTEGATGGCGGANGTMPQNWRQDAADGNSGEVVKMRELVDHLTKENNDVNTKIADLIQENQELKGKFETNKQDMEKITREMGEQMNVVHDDYRREIGELKEGHAAHVTAMQSMVEEFAAIRSAIEVSNKKVKKWLPNTLRLDGNNETPCSWTVKITKQHGTVNETFSPRFYTKEGYRMCLSLRRWWSKDGGEFGVRCYIMEGVNDEKIAWPWMGEMVVMVTNNSTGEDGECEVRGKGSPGRARPAPASRGNDFSLFNGVFKYDVDTEVDITVR